MYIYERHPALWIGALLLIPVGLALGWGTSLLPWAVFLLFPWIRRRAWAHILFALLIMGMAYIYAKAVTPQPLNINQAHGTGYFALSEIREEESPFGKHMVYIGTMRHFKSDQGKIAKHLPCRVYIKNKKNRPAANHDYLIEGRLSAKKHQLFVCKTDHMDWQAIKGTFSFAEWRYRIKGKAHRYLEKHFAKSRCLPLFSALTLGIIEERQLVNDFRNLGLSHILAISGFHFALGAGLLLAVLHPLLPKKLAYFLALILLSGYAFFLGGSPSVLRAWAAISLFLLGGLLGLRTSGLNALGVGLLAELLFDPLLASQLGFQLSFLATAAILLFYRPCEKLMQHLFVPRTLETLETMSFLDRHLYLVSSYLRKALALNTAVHLIVLPACLLHFQSFPLLSYLYNLFYPLLISLSMTALLLTAALDLFLPWIGQGLHEFNRLFTERTLEIVSHPPMGWNLRCPSHELFPWIFSLWALLLIVLFLRFDKKGVLPL